MHPVQLRAALSLLQQAQWAGSRGGQGAAKRAASPLTAAPPALDRGQGATMLAAMPQTPTTCGEHSAAHSPGLLLAAPTLRCGTRGPCCRHISCCCQASVTGTPRQGSETGTACCAGGWRPSRRGCARCWGCPASPGARCRGCPAPPRPAAASAACSRRRCRRPAPLARCAPLCIWTTLPDMAVLNSAVQALLCGGALAALHQHRHVAASTCSSRCCGVDAAEEAWQLGWRAQPFEPDEAAILPQPEALQVRAVPSGDRLIEPPDGVRGGGGS